MGCIFLKKSQIIRQLRCAFIVCTSALTHMIYVSMCCHVHNFVYTHAGLSHMSSYFTMEIFLSWPVPQHCPSPVFVLSYNISLISIFLFIKCHVQYSHEMGSPTLVELHIPVKIMVSSWIRHVFLPFTHEGTKMRERYACMIICWVTQGVFEGAESHTSICVHGWPCCDFPHPSLARGWSDE